MNTNIRYTGAKNISHSQQFTRLLIASAFIGIAMAVSAGTPAALVVLAIVAIYPLITGITGWDPVYDAFNISSKCDADGTLDRAARIELGIIGTALIGSVYAFSVLPTALNVLPLLGIYPALTALFGEDLLNWVHPVADQTDHDQAIEVTADWNRKHAEDHRKAA